MCIRDSAYVEVSGARIDVGAQARIALVRAALGLDRDVAEQELYGETDVAVDAQIYGPSTATDIADEVEFEEIESSRHHDVSEVDLQDKPNQSPDDEVKPE